VIADDAITVSLKGEGGVSSPIPLLTEAIVVSKALEKRRSNYVPWEGGWIDRKLI
jgi:hypothetical protein